MFKEAVACSAVADGTEAVLQESGRKGRRIYARLSQRLRLGSVGVVEKQTRQGLHLQARDSLSPIPSSDEKLSDHPEPAGPH